MSTPASGAYEALIQAGAAAMNGGRPDRHGRWTGETRTVLDAALPVLAELLRESHTSQARLPSLLRYIEGLAPSSEPGAAVIQADCEWQGYCHREGDCNEAGRCLDDVDPSAEGGESGR